MAANTLSVNYSPASTAVVVEASTVREASSTYDAARDDLGIPDAATMHKLLKSLHALGNEVRLALLDALVTFYEGHLCVELGYSSYHQYCERELGLGRSTAFEYLRAGAALQDLPRLRVLFKEGELSWQQVKAITRVASQRTEEAWLKLAVEAPVGELLAQVKDAQEAGRDAPRDRRHGLPNIMVRLTLNLTVEEKERLRAAFALVKDALDGGGDGPGDRRAGHGGKACSRPVLVRWADGILSGAIPPAPAGEADGAGGSTGGGQPGQTVVYHSCPQCRHSTVETQDGLVEVSPQRIEELEPHSRTVTIAPDEEVVAEALPDGEADAPNSQRLARQVTHRDGLTCQNPGCGGRRRLHAHHIVYRSAGGPTALSNEVTVCDRCHALIHAGLLEVAGHPGEVLTWIPRPVAQGVKVRDAEALRHRVAELAKTVPPPPRPTALPGAESLDEDSGPRGRARPVPTPIGGGESLDEDCQRLLEDLAEGLVRLRCGRSDSLRRVKTAYAKLVADGDPEPKEEDILRLALNV